MIRLTTSTQILRKGNVFLNAETEEVIEKFDSISQAKRKSRALQQANGGLGCGFVQVIPHKTRQVRYVSLKRNRRSS